MNILEEICKFKLEEVNILKKDKSTNFFKRNKLNFKTTNFIETLKKKNNSKYNIIAEIKKKSPSAGMIRENFDLIKIAMDYKRSGAVCLSVLTEKKYFGGNIEFLIQLKEAGVDLPILRKDFIVDEWQIYESSYYGADCILLILAVLDDEKFKRFYGLAKDLNLCILVEVHDEKELKRALNFNVDCIGVNNRNLKNLKIDLNTFKNLSKMIPSNVVKVCESGLTKNSDLKEMSKYGADSFLIGEYLMKKEDIYLSTKNLIRK